MSRSRRRLTCTAFAVAAWGLVIAPAAHAAAPVCTVSMGAMAFGNVNVLPGTAVDATATITVVCSGGSGGAHGQRVCISIGAGSSSDSTSRKMTSGANSARFDLYSDSARTQLWGSWQTGFDTAGVTLDVNRNSTTTVTVYGRFFGSQQSLVPGSYSSTFTANPFIQYDDKAGIACPTGSLTASTSTSATATVTNNCSVSATNVNFGSTGFLNSNIDATGTLSIQCSSTLPYSVSLDGGLSGATNPTQRKMTLSGSNILYGLYQDSARSVAWGSTVGTNTESGTGTGSTQSLTVYGRVASQTTPNPGTYNDTIVVTVAY